MVCLVQLIGAVGKSCTGPVGLFVFFLLFFHLFYFTRCSVDAGIIKLRNLSFISLTILAGSAFRGYSPADSTYSILILKRIASPPALTAARIDLSAAFAALHATFFGFFFKTFNLATVFA